MQNTRSILAAAAAVMFLAIPAWGQEPLPDQPPPYHVAQAPGGRASGGGAPAQHDEFIDKLNAATVSVMSGNPNGTYLYFAYDMSAVLDDGDNLRVLPVVGKGGGQNVKDILYLRGVDMGITQSNVLRYFNETGELGRNIADRVRFIARLNNEEMHLLARSEINSIEDLKGKKVNFSDAGSGTQLTCRLVFKDLKIPVQEVNMGQSDAFEAMKNGDIDATILIAGKPAAAYAKLRPNAAYKFVSVPYPAALQEHYLPAALTSDDYPALIAPDKPVNTIAVSAVLAVFNWAPNTDRYRRVARFTEAFFAKFDRFLEKPRHPKWKEVNLAAELPGWQRFPAAQEILDRDRNNNAELKQAFEQFIVKMAPQEAASMTPDRRDELFARFLDWQAAQQRQR